MQVSGARGVAAIRWRVLLWGLMIPALSLQVLSPTPLWAQETGATSPATPTGTAPSPASYQLAPGDEVSISVQPQKSYDCGGVLLPDGMLYLRGVGPLKAAGLALPQLQEQVRKLLSEKLVAPRVTATIVRLHTQDTSRGTLTLIGGISHAGPLPLTDGLRVRKAIELAGGVVKNADLTRVGILHKDLTRTVVDVSTAERVTDPAHNRLIQDGDSIEIPINPSKVAIVRGAVAHPGTVELDGEVRLTKALELAGGTTHEADLTRIIVLHADLSRAALDLSTLENVAALTQNIPIQHGDVIEVPAQAPLVAHIESVRISGQVLNPGMYPYRAGMALEDLIQAAGKLAPIADVSHIQIQHPGQAPRTVDLAAQLNMGLGGKVTLEPEDQVFVPEQKDTVVVIGAIAHPGPAVLRPGQNIVEFFTQNGPELAAALDPAHVDLTNVQLIRKGRETAKVNLKDALLKKKGKQPVVALQTGDVVFLPPPPAAGERRGPMAFLQNLGPLGMLMGLFTGGLAH